MIDINQVRSLHVEISSMCNARCPQCPRNFNGWNDPIELDEKNIDLNKLKEISTNFPNIPAVFCGNHGDPMMHGDIVECAKLFNKVSIDTNGSIGRVASYRELARQGVKIKFNIDGLEDTNHIYRQDTVWNNIIDRAKSFINAGGEATWRFIVFRHNQHQIENARELSKQLGFKKFEVCDVGRNHGPIMDNKGNVIDWLLPHDTDDQPGHFDTEFELRIMKDPIDLEIDYSDRSIDCELKREGNIYFNVNGELLPCCYHGVEQHINPVGDTPQEQLDSFKFLEENWHTEKCDPTCYDSCGR